MAHHSETTKKKKKTRINNKYVILLFAIGNCHYKSHSFTASSCGPASHIPHGNVSRLVSVHRIRNLVRIQNTSGNLS